jgi:hypothetical protein
MGYLKPVETDPLALPSDKQWVVHMKKRANWGDTAAAQAAMVHEGMVAAATRNQALNGSGPADEAAQVAEVISGAETDAYMQTLVARLIVTWNLTDEQGQPLHVSVDTVALLEPEDGEFLAEQAQKRRGGRPAAQQRPFKKPSGQRPTATPSSTPKPGE